MSDWTKIRDTTETAAVLAGNYFFPGSSMITSHLVSDGSQEQLNSDAGKLAQLGTGGTGIYDGNLANWVGGNGNGLKLPSFMGGGESASVAGPTSTSGVDWANAPDQSAAETSRLLRQDATANGTPVGADTSINWGAKAEEFAQKKAIEAGVNQAMGGNKQQQQPVDEAPQTMPKQDDSRRQALMQKAAELRARIAELRSRISQQESVQQTTGIPT